MSVTEGQMVRVRVDDDTAGIYVGEPLVSSLRSAAWSAASVRLKDVNDLWEVLDPLDENQIIDLKANVGGLQEALSTLLSLAPSPDEDE